MKQTIVWVVAMGFLGGVGCGDESPAEKCDDLVSLACDRAVDCISGASGMHDACVQGVQQVLSCSAVKSIGKGYDRCVSQLGDGSCQILFPIDPLTGQQGISLPADCEGVLSTQSTSNGAAPGLQVTAAFAGTIQRMISARAVSTDRAP